MTDSKSENNERKVLQDASSSDDSLDELRRLLLDPMQMRLENLEDRIDNPKLHARDVSRVLPEAISLRSAQDRKIDIVLEPITTNAIRSSINKDRKVLVDALFPIMGPAIRKAIASAIQAMIEGFNQVLEHSLSPKSLKWRLEALRTNKSFAEVVFLRTLIYHVEQIFLIHKDTGLVLQHVVSKADVAYDPDLVSRRDHFLWSLSQNTAHIIISPTTTARITQPIGELFFVSSLNWAWRQFSRI